VNHPRGFDRHLEERIGGPDRERLGEVSGVSHRAESVEFDRSEADAIAAWYGGNSWVDATGDVSAAARADRRGLLVLTVAYFAAAVLLLVLTLT
jgi:hypothetical protein